jgi:hypothetical protein
MSWLDTYITTIFAIKVVFITTTLIHMYLKKKGKFGSKLDKQVEYWKERSEFVFILLMSVLLIYLFHPYNSRIDKITKETKVLLFLFGFILIIRANWNIFIQEAKWFKTIQQIIGN